MLRWKKIGTAGDLEYGFRADLMSGGLVVCCFEIRRQLSHHMRGAACYVWRVRRIETDGAVVPFGIWYSRVVDAKDAAAADAARILGRAAPIAQPGPKQARARRVRELTSDDAWTRVMRAIGVLGGIVQVPAGYRVEVEDGLRDAEHAVVFQPIDGGEPVRVRVRVERANEVGR